MNNGWFQKAAVAIVITGALVTGCGYKKKAEEAAARAEQAASRAEDASRRTEAAASRAEAAADRATRAANEAADRLASRMRK